MATRIAARYVSRRLSSGGKMLSEEEKVVENVYIKQLAQGGQVSYAKPSDSYSSTSTTTVSKGNFRNYAAIAGVVTVVGAVGWYLRGSKDKPEEVQN